LIAWHGEMGMLSVSVVGCQWGRQTYVSSSSFVVVLRSQSNPRRHLVAQFRSRIQDEGRRQRTRTIVGVLPPLWLAVFLFWVPSSCPTGRIAGRKRFFACLLDLEFGRIVLDWFLVRLTPFFRRFRAHSANSEALHSFASTTFRKSMPPGSLLS
jgi:hypothetical protein